MLVSFLAVKLFVKKDEPMQLLTGACEDDAPSEILDARLHYCFFEHITLDYTGYWHKSTLARLKP